MKLTTAHLLGMFKFRNTKIVVSLHRPASKAMGRATPACRPAKPTWPAAGDQSAGPTDGRTPLAALS